MCLLEGILSKYALKKLLKNQKNTGATTSNQETYATYTPPVKNQHLHRYSNESSDVSDGEDVGDHHPYPFNNDPPATRALAFSDVGRGGGSVVLPEYPMDTIIDMNHTNMNHNDSNQPVWNPKRNEIIIEGDKQLEDLELHDCLNIRVINCPLVKSIPDIGAFNLLESMTLSHLSLTTFTGRLPATLSSLRIKYCGLQEFRPENVVNLVELDLSFNKLKEIPACISQFKAMNENMRVSLRNNDFWFEMYSNLPYSMISPGVVNELRQAHSLGLVGTAKLKYAVHCLNQKEFTEEATQLAQLVNIELEQRRVQEAKTTYNDKQNVHLTSVQKAFRESLKYVMAYTPQNTYRDGLPGILKTLKFDRKTEKKVKNSWNLQTTTADGYTYQQIMLKVYMIINDEKDKETRESMLQSFKEEIKQGVDTCFTGQVTRLVNSLGGYNVNIKVGISRNEEIANSILVLRKKYTLLYPGDTDKYIEECIPAAWQLLEDMCVPEPEHMVWLEYI